MFGNQAIGVLLSLFKGGQGLCISRVAQCHTYVAQKAATFGSYHGRSSKLLLEPLISPLSPLQLIGLMQSLEVDGFHTFAFLRETIPRADF